MTSFGTQKDDFEFNEIEVVDGKNTSLPESENDEIHRNLEVETPEAEYSRRPSSQPTQPTSPLYNIPFDALTRRERKRLLKLERKIQRRKLHYDYKAERARIKADLKAERRRMQEGKTVRYNWAFTVACFLIGLGITVLVDTPTPLFIGLALGVLFFVDPIYDKVMQMIKDI